MYKSIIINKRYLSSDDDKPWKLLDDMGLDYHLDMSYNQYHITFENEEDMLLAKLTVFDKLRIEVI